MERRTFIAGTAALVCPRTAAGIGRLAHDGGDHPVRRRDGVSPFRFRYLGLDPASVYARPCFAPDGRRILFMRSPATEDPTVAISSDASPWALWTVTADGGTPERFFEHGSLRATRPDWHWATGKIVFTGIRDTRAELWLLDADGGNLTHVPVGDPPRTRLFYPSWYPDGDAVAVTDYAAREVLRVDIATGDVEALTDSARIWAGMCSVSGESTRDTTIAFAGQRPGASYRVSHNRIWVLRPGSDPVALDADHGRTPAWSPGGRVLAFSSDRRRPAPSFILHARRLPGGISGIYLRRNSDPEGAGASSVAVSPFDVSAIHPKWSPDGRVLACMAHDVAGSRRGLATIEVA